MKKTKAHIHVTFRKRPPIVDQYDCLPTTPRGILLASPPTSNRYTSELFHASPNLRYWDQHKTNSDIFLDEFRPQLQAFLEGNGGDGILVLTYGQTGSGKTYTLLGGESNGIRYEGLIQQSMRYLYTSNLMKSTPQIRGIEIYEKQMNDILRHKKPIPGWASILEYPCSEAIPTYRAARSALQRIILHKRMGKTKANSNSSRSHTIYDVELEGRHLVFIDLAGTERGRYSIGNNRHEMREGSAINQSLFSLKECIRALGHRDAYIPYRRSRLTMMLRDIFHKRFYIHFVATLSASPEHFHDTLDTLRYGYSLHRTDLASVKRIPKEPSPPHKQVSRPEVGQYSLESTLSADQFVSIYFRYIMKSYRLLQGHHLLYKQYTTEQDTPLCGKEVIRALTIHRDFIERTLEKIRTYQGIAIRPTSVRYKPVKPGAPLPKKRSPLARRSTNSG